MCIYMRVSFDPTGVVGEKFEICTYTGLGIGARGGLAIATEEVGHVECVRASTVCSVTINL